MPASTTAAPVPQASTAPAETANRDKPKASAKFGIWPWVGLGAGAAVLGGSLGFELARRSAEKDAEKDETQIGYKEKFDREQSRQTTARILAAVGGALAVTGGTLLVIQLTSRDRSAESAPRVGFGCLPGACNVDLKGRF